MHAPALRDLQTAGVTLVLMCVHLLVENFDGVQGVVYNVDVLHLPPVVTPLCDEPPVPCVMHTVQEP